MKRFSNTQILGACGLAAAFVGTGAGVVGALDARAGVVLSGVANAIMLTANLVLLLRKDPK